MLVVQPTRPVVRHRELDADAAPLSVSTKLKLYGRDVDLLLLEQRRMRAEVGRDGADIRQDFAQRLEGGLDVGLACRRVTRANSARKAVPSDC